MVHHMEQGSSAGIEQYDTTVCDKHPNRYCFCRLCCLTLGQKIFSSQFKIVAFFIYIFYYNVTYQ